MDSKEILGIAMMWLGMAIFVIIVWAGVHEVGKRMQPTIIHHETEHAHCYTAGKMFFVSIACVGKD